MNVIKIAILSMFLTACSVETMNMGDGGEKSPAPAEEEEKPARPEGESPEPKEGESNESVLATTTTTTTTTTTAAGGSGGGKAGALKTYKLVNKNAAVGDFVSENYCRGAYTHDCWLKSGTLTEQKDGAFAVSLEFWNTTFANEPYAVLESVLSGEGAVLLTDMAKMPKDDGIEFRMLWAVVDTKAKTLKVVYDWAGDGPQAQGDDLLQSFTFVEKVASN